MWHRRAESKEARNANALGAGRSAQAGGPAAL
jgi:hypothetical protein